MKSLIHVAERDGDTTVRRRRDERNGDGRECVQDMRKNTLRCYRNMLENADGMRHATRRYYKEVGSPEHGFFYCS